MQYFLRTFKTREKCVAIITQRFRTANFQHLFGLTCNRNPVKPNKNCISFLQIAVTTKSSEQQMLERAKEKACVECFTFMNKLFTEWPHSHEAVEGTQNCDNDYFKCKTVHLVVELTLCRTGVWAGFPAAPAGRGAGPCGPV